MDKHVICFSIQIEYFNCTLHRVLLTYINIIMPEITEYVSTEKYQESVLGDIMKSIMTPGYTGNSVVRIMNYAFYGLFLTLLGLLWASGGNMHVVALLLLSICLFVCITLFINEGILQDELIKKQKQAEQEEKDK